MKTDFVNINNLTKTTNKNNTKKDFTEKNSITINKNTDFSKMELTGLPASFFIPNQKRFFSLSKTIYDSIKKPDEFDTNTVLILQGGVTPSRYDADCGYYHFSQEGHFYYLSGVLEEGLYLAADFQTEKITLFYDQPDINTSVWQKALTKEEIKEKYQLDTELLSNLYTWLDNRKPNKIFTLEGTNKNTGLPVPSAFEYLTTLKTEFVETQKKVVKETVMYEILKASRRVKSTEELELLKFICKSTNECHNEMMKNIKADMLERDVENFFISHSSDKYYTRIWGYPCIGGCGVNGATLHYDINNKMCKDGEIFLADMGMRFCNYVSDVTITIPVNGKYTDKQAELYELCLKSNRETMSMVKEGVSFKSLDTHSKKVILEGLQKLGFIVEGPTRDELFDAGLAYYFMPHGLGHHVGIEVHDVTVLDPKYKNYDLLEAGNIITIEPGIYFRDFLLDKGFNDEKIAKLLVKEKVKSYYDFGGIRIEDDIIVTKDGFVNMNADLVREVKDIEALMASNKK